MNIQVDIDGTMTGIQGMVVAFGIQVSGESIIEVDNFPSDLSINYVYIDGEFYEQPFEP